MYTGKYLIFIAGISAGVATMFVASFVSEKNAPEALNVDVSERQTPALSSPFTVSSATDDDAQSGTSAVENIPVAVAEPAQSPLPDAELLGLRLDAAESRIEALEVEIASLRVLQDQTGNNAAEDFQTELSNAGFEPSTIANIESIRSGLQLQRLELRDQATREGWINTDRFSQERRQLGSGSKLRELLGDEGYDKLLLAEGRDNRIRIDSVIDGSAADTAGITVGDVVIRYADQRVFNFRGLQQATTEGDRNELVTVQVSRDGQLIDLTIARGPMGVTLSQVTESN